MQSSKRLPEEKIVHAFLRAVSRAIREDGWSTTNPVAEVAHGLIATGPKYLLDRHEPVTQLPLEWREHAAAVTAAIQLGDTVRQDLGAYFTPPHLTAHVIQRLIKNGYVPKKHRIIDPAAGGAAFLAPLYKVISEEMPRKRVDTALRLMDGIEINRDLGKVTRELIAWRIALSRGDKKPTLVDRVAAKECVQIADTLKRPAQGQYDAVVGNPPYVRIGKDRFREFAANFPGLTDGGGYLNLSMVFAQHCMAFLKVGGLLSFVMPAGFIGGPSFSAFRKTIANDVIAIDRIEKREGVFADVTQDCVILTLKKGGRGEDKVHVYSLPGDGSEIELGGFVPCQAGGAWELPAVGPRIKTGPSLNKKGWSGSIGAVVPHRWIDRLVSGKSRGKSLPLIWAAAIRPDGTFDYHHMRKHIELNRVSVDPEAPYVVRKPCVLVQRTSNRKQKKLVNAAPVCSVSLRQIGGAFVAENHVIVLTPPYGCENPDQIVFEMAGILNSDEANRIYDMTSGTASVSVKRLLDMKLPARCLIPGFDGAILSLEWRDALWAKFSMGAPQRQRRSVEQSKIVKRA